MWDRVRVVTKPTADVITLPDLMLRLRIDTADETTLLAALLKGAVAAIDGPDGIGYALMEQTWRLSLDGFPRVICLPGAPVKSVASIKYIDTTGVEQTLATDRYRVDADVDPARIEPAYGQSWPSTRNTFGAVKVDYALGETAAASVPADLVDAVCLLVGHRYQNREAVSVGSAASEYPLAVEWVLSRYRRNAVSA